MKTGWIFRILMCICCHHLMAQENGVTKIEDDYRNFREIYNQEFQNPDSSLQLTRISFHPVSLPHWLSRLPGDDANSLYAIGISDPGMQEEEALELATLRAKIITALLLKSKISSITDSYSNDSKSVTSNKFTTKYAVYYSLVASLAGSDNQFEIVNHFFTSAKEAVVLIKYDISTLPDNNADSLMLKIDVYHAERQQRNSFEFEEKCEVYGLSKQNWNEEDVDIFYYFYRSINQLYEIVSRFNGKEIDFPQRVFRYQSLENSGLRSEISEVSYRLTYGLWKAYIQSLIQSYTQSVESLDVEIAQLNDNFTSSTQNLSREVVISAPNYRIAGVNVNNNRLSVILNRNEVNH